MTADPFGAPKVVADHGQRGQEKGKKKEKRKKKEKPQPMCKKQGP